MADNRYQSKYSRITQDPAYQSVNPHMKKDLTIEEYYDLLHHTHEGMANADETNAKMYLINYCFVSGSKIDTSLFEESYSIIKDKTIP